MNITLTKQYTTRSGLPVKLYDILNNETVTGAYFVSQRNLWIPETWTLSGSYSNEAMFVRFFMQGRKLIFILRILKCCNWMKCYFCELTNAV